MPSVGHLPPRRGALVRPSRSWGRRWCAQVDGIVFARWPASDLDSAEGDDIAPIVRQAKSTTHAFWGVVVLDFFTARRILGFRGFGAERMGDKGGKGGKEGGVKSVVST